MADLDDFFAKKDRKKSKGKKFLTADELVKNLEDTSKREPQKPKKELAPAGPVDAPIVTNVAVVASENSENVTTTEQLPAPQQPQVSTNAAPAVEEEWKEIEVERKDYSGLKIGQLNINEDEHTQRDNNAGDGENDEDEENEGNENYQMSDMKGHGPWKKVIPAEEVTQIPMGPGTGIPKYIAPAFKLSQNSSALRRKLPKGTAPDITNEDFFPTLGAARPEEQKKKKNEPAFEEVRHGGRVQQVREQTAAPVSVGNRFQSLEDDDS